MARKSPRSRDLNLAYCCTYVVVIISSVPRWEAFHLGRRATMGCTGYGSIFFRPKICITDGKVSSTMTKAQELANINHLCFFSGMIYNISSTIRTYPCTSWFVKHITPKFRQPRVPHAIATRMWHIFGIVLTAKDSSSSGRGWHKPVFLLRT